MSFTIGSLFDGSGGFPLAATMCGGTPKWSSEIEPYPIAVTKSRFPGIKHLGSVTDIKGGEVEPVDVITFGSPCQDLSVAGKRAGLKHTDNGDDETTRSGLFMEAVRIIKEMREVTNGVYPRFALWENVPGAFSSNKGEDFRIVLEELIQVAEPTAVMPEVPKNGWPYADSYCGEGWSLSYRTLDAQYWGVPQRRRRIYLVADFRGECAGKVSFEREGLRGYFETGRTPWQTAAGDAEAGSGAADCERTCYGVVSKGNGEAWAIREKHMALSCGGGQAGQGYPCAMVSGAPKAKSSIGGIGLDIYNLAVTGEVAASLTTATGQGASNTGPSVAVPVFALDQQGGKGSANYAVNVMPTLCSDSHGTPHAVAYQSEPVIAVDQGGGKSGANYHEEVSPTLTCTHGGEPAIAYGADSDHIVRRLTPTECARLQGFPDTWGHLDEKTELTDDEYLFWLNVRNTYAAINDKPTRKYTRKQMLKWYNGRHTDTSEYKMWGNGIALPCALYVMQGIAEVMSEEKNSRRKWLMDILGDGL